MAELNQLNAEFLIPYLTILNYFKYTGINVFDEKDGILYRFEYTQCIVFLFYTCNLISHWRYVVEEMVNKTDLLELAVDLSYCINCIEGCLIYLHFCGIKNRIKNYIIILGKQWRDDETLTENAIEMKRSQIKQVDLYTFGEDVFTQLWEISRLTLIMMNLVSVYCTLLRVFVHFYMASPLIIILIQKFVLSNEIEFTTPLKFTLPFNHTSNVVVFVVVYLVDYTLACSLAYFINCSLFFIAVTMSQLRTLFMLLQEDFKEVINSKDEAKLKSTIQRHLELSKLLGELSEAFGAIFAIHVLFLSITICFYGIAARINSRMEDFKNFLISILTIINIYHCCRHGQLVTDAALDIATFIYDSAWEELSDKNEKIILITMLRSQRATYVRSMKCIEISYKTFVTILNMSWSFISLITKLYQD